MFSQLAESTTQKQNPSAVLAVSHPLCVLGIVCKIRQPIVANPILRQPTWMIQVDQRVQSLRLVLLAYKRDNGAR